MGNISKALIWTNPITYICGIPFITGIILASMFDGVAKKTKRVIDDIDF